MKASVDFTLKTPVSFIELGKEVEAEQLLLFPPSYKSIQHAGPLKQAIVRAIKQVSKENAEQIEAERLKRESLGEHAEPEPERDPDEPLIPGGAILGILMGSNEDFAKIVVHFSEMVCGTGLVMVNGTTKLTKPIFESMTMEDMERLVGEYLSYFLMPSATSG